MGQPIKSYRDLEVWRQSMSIAKLAYLATESFPSEERFGIVNRMRRAAVSIPSNIVEGHARGSSGEFQRFITIATGSIAELETQIMLSADLGYLAAEASEDLLQKLDGIGIMLRAIHRSLQQRPKG